MIRENLHRSLDVYYETSDTCTQAAKQLNFFEFFFVLSGKGTHIVNENKIEFNTNDLFLITPNDQHSFHVEEFCEFIVIRFSQNYVADFQWKSIDHMECVLFHASHLSECILKNPEDRETVTILMKQLLYILQKESMYKEDLIRHLVNAIIVIAARNLSLAQPKNMLQNVDEKILDIIDYIQLNIHYPDLLKLEIIAAKFGLSKTYIGSYFRKQSGESIQEYISSYRIRLIEHRLQFSSKRIAEIADEFGFNDESHINKFFKRHTGFRLKSYRELHQKKQSSNL